MEEVKINTATGQIPSGELGATLMHEHIAFGYPGWVGDHTMGPFDRNAIVATTAAVFTQLKALGLKSYVDATANEVGRCPELYREISEKTGIHVIFSTGYYYEGEGSAAYWKFRGLLGDINEEIYELFMTEITQGFAKTGIKAGVIKVGSSHNEITDYEQILFRTAARVQKETGVPIITHTQEGTMGPEQAELLIEAGADPGKVMIGHMSDNLDKNYQIKTLDKGVYVAWDRMGLQGLAGCPMDDQRYDVMANLIKGGYDQRMMISHDAIINWLGRPLNIPEDYLPFIANWNPTHLFVNVIPALKARGVTQDQIHTIIEANPRRLFEGT